MDTPTVNRRQAQPSQRLVMSPAHFSAGSAANPKTAIGISSSGQLQPNRNTWSSSAYVDPNSEENVKGDANKDANKLSDLEILAKQEMIYCMSQSKSGLQTPTLTMKNMMRHNDSLISHHHQMKRMSITSTGEETMTETGSCTSSSMRIRKIGRDETALMEAGKANRL